MATNRFKKFTGVTATTATIMQNPFDAPPEGAVANPIERPLAVEYKTNKTPAAYADKATPGAIPSFVQNLALGFMYYDKEQGKRVSLPELTFVVLEVYAGISGYDETSGTSYWSNRAKDTRTDELLVYAAAGSPILRGLYADIKPSLPTAAKYTKFVRAYCVQTGSVIEIKLNASAERGMQKGIEAAEHAAGRPKFKWESVFILDLAQNDHLWGFHLNGYRKTTKEGADYAGNGEVYFEPVFHAGLVSPDGKNRELWEKCRALQEEQRTAHELYKQRNAAKATAEAAAPVATVQAAAATHTPQAPYTPASGPINTNVTANHGTDDDLPF